MEQNFGVSDNSIHKNLQIIRLNKYKQFHKENNGEKIFMKNSYNINKGKVEEWRQKMKEMHKNHIYHEFADIFSENFEHISFNDFYDKILKMRQELKDFIKKRKEKGHSFSDVLLVLDRDIDSSNMWISLLLLDIELLNELTGITKSSDEILLNRKNAFYIYPDDMVYSGTQLSNNLDELVSLRENKNLYYLAIPYMTKYAFIKYNPFFQQNNVILSKFLELPLSIGDLFKNKYSEEKTNEILKALSYNLYNPEAKFLGNASPGKTSVYFDHKVADYLSTFENVIRFGADSNEHFVGSLLTDCDTPDMQPLPNGAYGYFFHVGESCPKTFYKTIEYTYNGKSLKEYKFSSFDDCLKVLNGLPEI